MLCTIKFIELNYNYFWTTIQVTKNGKFLFLLNWIGNCNSSWSFTVISKILGCTVLQSYQRYLAVLFYSHIKDTWLYCFTISFMNWHVYHSLDWIGGFDSQLDLSKAWSHIGRESTTESLYIRKNNWIEFFSELNWIVTFTIDRWIELNCDKL